MRYHAFIVRSWKQDEKEDIQVLRRGLGSHLTEKSYLSATVLFSDGDTYGPHGLCCIA